MKADGFSMTDPGELSFPAFRRYRGPPMSKFRTFALVNQKGGVGKQRQRSILAPLWLR